MLADRIDQSSRWLGQRSSRQVDRGTGGPVGTVRNRGIRRCLLARPLSGRTRKETGLCVELSLKKRRRRSFEGENSGGLCRGLGLLNVQDWAEETETTDGALG